MCIQKKASSWLSCRIIVPNIVAAYDGLSLKNARSYGFDRYSTVQEIWDAAKAIHDFNPERIIFLDHSPHPTPVLRALATVYQKKKLPPLIFHLYGDFTYYSREWLALSDLLENTPVQFICASKRQVQLVGKFLEEPKKHISLCHFPVNKNKFFFDPKIREETRDQLGIAPDETVLLYTGRLALQKNIVTLLRRSVQYFLQTRQKFKILLAGDYDDMGAPFFGVKRFNGSYFHWLEFNQNLLPPEIRKNIKFLGHVEGAELSALYNAADVFASISLHHDEDYGMSPAEALCCGLRCLLTDWGGYASFKKDDSSCSLVNVRISKKGLVISPTDFKRGLDNLFVPESIEQRQARAEKYQESLSIETASRILNKILIEKPLPFDGFSWRLKRHAQLMKETLFAEGPVKNTFYEEIYEAYTRDF